MVTSRYRDNFWKRWGKLGGNVLFLDKSKIENAGDGVFTNKYILPNTIVTEYSGYIKNKIKFRKRKGGLSLKYSYQLGISRTLIGIRKKSVLYGRGMAQLANDAINKELSYYENNCKFCEIDGRVFLKSKRLIKPGEELLVDYGLQYWMHEIINNSHIYPKKYLNWIELVINICDLWSLHFKPDQPIQCYRVATQLESDKIKIVLDKRVNTCCHETDSINFVFASHTGHFNVECDQCKSVTNISVITHDL